MMTIPKIVKILNNIDDTEKFSEEFTDFITGVIPYDGITDPSADTKELYFVFFMGMLCVTGYEYKINTKRELGKPDISLKTPWYHAIFEIMVVDSGTDEIMQKGAEEAIKQIEGKYLRELGESSVYKIGIACHGKKCLVKTVLH